MPRQPKQISSPTVLDKIALAAFAGLLGCSYLIGGWPAVGAVFFAAVLRVYLAIESAAMGGR